MFCPIEISVTIKLVSRPNTKTRVELLRLKITHDRSGVFSSLFKDKNCFKIINFFEISVCGDGKQLVNH